MSTKDLIQAELDRLDEALLNDIYLFIRTFIQAKQNTSSETLISAQSTAFESLVAESPSPYQRDHSAFLNSYTAADEGLYDDITG